jgi:phosphoribosylglycinamide formyltransferase 1
VNKAKVAVLISGEGSNLQSLIDACRDEDYPAEISCVISNRDDAYGLNRAANESIPCHVVNPQDFLTREAFDQAMQELIKRHSAEFVCLAGYMRLLSLWFIDQWRGRILNIHPSLLPEFKGTHAVRDALSAGVKETGCSVHHVTEEMDSGLVMAQARVPVLPGDTEESLHDRIKEAEHRIYPEALQQLILSAN